MESPRLFRFAILHENVPLRTLAVLVAALIVAVLIYRVLSSYILGHSDWYLLLLLLLAALLLVAMANLLLVACDRANFVVVSDEAVTFTIRRPNTSPVHLTILLGEITSVSEFRPDNLAPFAGVDYDPRTDALMVLPQAWSKNIIITLRHPKHVAWTQLRRLVVPRLRRSEYTFSRLVFAPSPHGECFAAILRAFEGRTDSV